MGRSATIRMHVFSALAVAFGASCGDAAPVEITPPSRAMPSGSSGSVRLALFGSSMPSVPSAPSGFSGLDAVMVIDQSGSMDKYNDRRGKRIEAVWVAFAALVQDVKGTHRVHRVAVVEYGTRIASLWERPVEIRYDPGDPDGALLRSDVERRITAKNLGFTDTTTALQRASEELKAMRADRNGLPDGRRNQAMLLVTDGKPELEQKRENSADHQGDIRKLAAEAELHGTLWVVGLTDTRAPGGDYWSSGWGQFWQTLLPGADPGERPLQFVQHVAAYDTIARRDDIRDTIAAITRQWVGATRGSAAEVYLCPPYLKSVVFDIELDDPGDIDIIDIRDPDNIPVAVRKFVTAPGSRSVQVVIDNPTPGLWRLNRPGQAYSVTPEPHYNHVQLLAPVTPQKRHSEVVIQYQVTGRDGKPFTMDMESRYPVKAIVRVEYESSSASDEIEMKLADEWSKFASAQPFMPDQPGPYNLFFTAAVEMKNAAGKPVKVEVFRSQSIKNDILTVDDAAPLVFVLDEPRGDDKAVLWFGSGAVHVRGHLALLDNPDEPLGFDQLGSGAQPDKLLRAQLRVSDSAVDGPAVALVANPGADSHSLEASLPIERSIMSADWLLRRGAVELHLIADHRAAGNDHFVKAIAQSDGPAGQAPTTEMATHPLPVREAWLIWLALLFGVGFSVVSLILFASRLGRHMVYRIQDRYIERRRPVLVLRNLYNPDEDFKLPISGKQFDFADRQFDVGFDQPWVVERLRVKRIPTRKRHVRIEAEYVPPDPDQLNGRGASAAPGPDARNANKRDADISGETDTAGQRAARDGSADNRATGDNASSDRAAREPASSGAEVAASTGKTGKGLFGWRRRRASQRARKPRRFRLTTLNPNPRHEIEELGGNWVFTLDPRPLGGTPQH
ncbi:MAG: VWA domain-containing protein [Proteobacteria bacterium]|nr:VWA domain-containing protein [Pseudomonadota bacterium]